MATKDLLKDFGFKEREAAVYVALLQLGEAKVHEIALKARVSRSSTYEILEKLAEDNFVFFLRQAEIRHYVASDPEIFKKNLESKQYAFNIILPELRSIYNRLKSKTENNFSRRS